MFFYSLLLFNIISIVLNEPNCTEGINYCSRCNPIAKICVKCEKDIYTPDESGGCKNARTCRVGTNYCVDCFEDGHLCRLCDEGYFRDGNGGCSLTDNCEVSYRGECLKCKDNYILMGKKSEDPEFIDKIKFCKPLSSEQFLHCIDIYEDLGICNTCEEGYYLSYSDLKCTKIKNCAYSSYGECKKCDFGYYFDKKQQKCLIQEGKFINCKISIDGQVCNECDDDSYFDQEGKCVWSKYCAEGERYHCNKCIEGYYLTVLNGICTTEENCFDGRKDIGVCTQCKEFYCTDFIDGKCKSNLKDDDYKFCKFANGECTQCIEGAYLSNNKRCSKTSNCDKVEKGICTKCIENYYLGLDNKCTNVEKCIYSDNDYHCIECEENYFYNKGDNSCKVAEGKFKNCKYGNQDDNNCEMCKDNFYLNETDNLCYSNNNEDFNKCSKSNGENCTQCLSGYYLGILDNKCSKVAHCLIIENENWCLYCEEKYVADGKTGKCEFNFVILDIQKSFYYRCNRTNSDSTACEICSEGYEIKNGLCFDEKHCSERDEAGHCKRCDKIEGDMYYQCLNDDFGCIETMFYDNCLECNDIKELGHCTKCIEGYDFNKYNFCEEIGKE